MEPRDTSDKLFLAGLVFCALAVWIGSLIQPFSDSAWSPTSGLASACLVKQTLAQSDKDNPRRVDEADFFSRYAVKLAPQDAEVAKLRAEIEGQIRKLTKP